MLASFSSSMLSAALTVGIYVAGHFTADLQRLPEIVDSRLVSTAATGLAYVLPDLSAFDISSDVVHAQAVETSYLALMTGYAFLYVAVLVLGAMCVFSRRDFT